MTKNEIRADILKKYKKTQRQIERDMQFEGKKQDETDEAFNERKIQESSTNSCLIDDSPLPLHSAVMNWLARQINTESEIDKFNNFFINNRDHINDVDKNGRTFVHLVSFMWPISYASNLYTHLVSLTTEYINPNDETKNLLEKKDNDGRTALHLAVISRNYNALYALIKWYNRVPNININICDNKGCTPLWLAAGMNEDTSVDTILKYKNINKDFKSNDTTPLEIAQQLLQKTKYKNIKIYYKRIILLLQGKWFASIRSYFGGGGSLKMKKSTRKLRRKNKTTLKNASRPKYITN
jgi:ankyrin repeat protein